MGLDMGKNDEQFSEATTQRRFEALVRSALKTPPKPLKSMTPKRSKAQRKKNPKRG